MVPLHAQLVSFKKQHNMFRKRLTLVCFKSTYSSVLHASCRSSKQQIIASFVKFPEFVEIKAQTSLPDLVLNYHWLDFLMR